MPERRNAPKWLLVGILLAVAANLWSVVGTLAEAPNYATLNVSFSPTVRIVLSGVWAILLTLLLIGLLRCIRLAFNWTAPLLSLNALTSLSFAVLFVRSDYSRGRFFFQLVLTLIILIPVWWVALRKRWLRIGQLGIGN